MTGALAAYTITEILREDLHGGLYRATRDGDRASVLLRTIDPVHSRPTDLERMRHEYDTAHALDLREVVRPVALDTFQGLPVVVLEGCCGVPLDRLIAGPMELAVFLPLAVRLAGAVAALHAHGLIHRDL